jgi:hypothetical protein
MMFPGDEIWDEDRWEAFLRENDRRLDRYMHLLFHFMKINPPPDDADTPARRSWERDLRRYLSGEETGPTDDEWDGDIDDAFPDADTEKEEELYSFHDIPAYGMAFHLSALVLDWSNSLPGDAKDSTLVQFCSNVTQVPANLAKGHDLGFDHDMIGGNIACAKRALTAANTALDLLRDLKTAPCMDPASYRILYEQAFELRNEIGLYVQELRGKFDLGID